MRRLAFLILVCVGAILCCSSCGGESETIYNVNVEVTPLTVDVAIGATQPFTATTYGAADTAVIWHVNGEEGGNSTYGTISPDGLYMAPAVVPNPSTVTVTAISHANENNMASASVRLISGIGISVLPANVDLQFGQTQQFSAAVTGSSNSEVTWQAGGVTGGNSTVGTISTAGLYTAPSTSATTPLSVSVTAISKADATKSARASVTIHGDMSVAVSPNPASVETFGTLQFTAAVTGASDADVTWKINGVAGGSATTGTISAGGLFRAPRSVPTRVEDGASKTTTVTVTAVSQADSSASASVALTIYAANSKQQTLPIPLGVSGGNAGDSSSTAGICCGGTLGALVSRGGKQYILSTSHVLAPNESSAVGDAVVQPGLLDSGCSTSETTSVATLSQWATLRNASGATVDAALAEVIAGAVDSQGTILQLGDTLENGVPNNGAPHAGYGVSPTTGMAVAKSGRSTGLTCSTISAIDITASIELPVSCGSSETYQITVQNAVGIFDTSFGAQGDSGSLIITQDTADPVAILVASTDAETIAIPVSDVLSSMADPSTGEIPTFVGSSSGHAVAGCSSTGTLAVTSASLTSGTTVSDSGALSSSEVVRARAAYTKHLSSLMALRGVQGVGIGSSDEPGEAALIIFAIRGASQDAIPAAVDGVRTRIRESGRFKVESGPQVTADFCSSPRKVSLRHSDKPLPNSILKLRDATELAAGSR